MSALAKAYRGCFATLMFYGPETPTCANEEMAHPHWAKHSDELLLKTPKSEGVVRSRFIGRARPASDPFGCDLARRVNFVA